MWDQPIKIYTAPHCKYSPVAKKLLDKHEVPYEEHNVVQNAFAYQEMVEKTHQSGVPVIEIGNHVFAGFDRKGIERVLGV